MHDKGSSIPQHPQAGLNIKLTRQLPYLMVSNVDGTSTPMANSVSVAPKVVLSAKDLFLVMIRHRGAKRLQPVS